MASSDAVLEYLREIQDESITRLYEENIWVVMAVLRSLPQLARQVVMRTAYLDEPSDPWSWVSSAEEHQEQLRAALVKMHAVHALIVPNNGKLSKKRMIELSPTFKAQMRRSLALRHTSPWNGGKDVPQDESITAEWLRKWGLDRWESLLHYMVASVADGQAMKRPEENWQPSKKVKEILIENRDGRGLMHNEKITEAGFSFLLRPPPVQVWQLLLKMLPCTRQEKGEKVHLEADSRLHVGCIFQLSFCSPGTAYSFKGLEPVEEGLIKILGEIGFVYIPQGKKHFYPTSLILNIFSERAVTTRAHSACGTQGRQQPVQMDCDDAVAQQDEDCADAVALEDGRCIMVETNFRVYAYTSSTLQEQILRLFTQVQYKFPNLVISLITRSSVRNALKVGISAAQIIEYLSVHAHPQWIHARRHTPLPDVVADQLGFWELERKRIREEPVYVYDGFLDSGGFERMKRICGDTVGGQSGAGQDGDMVIDNSSCLLYENNKEQILVVRADAHEDVIGTWKRDNN